MNIHITKQSRIKRIHDFGQSIWLDFLDRKIMNTGDLKELIDNDGVGGVTFNPAIFESAISSSLDYDDDIAAFSDRDFNREEIFFAIAVKDIQRAVVLFKPAYDNSKGNDSFMSLEVSPLLARDTNGTIKQARELWRAVDRQNIIAAFTW